jgi:hypothetical protein
MTNRKTYYPPKTFDDALEGLANLYQEKGWSFSGIDTEQLQRDAEAQRLERTDHDKLESQYLNVHETFGVAQEARSQRYGSALQAARGAFRRDKAVMAELNRFKRSTARRAAPKARTVKTQTPSKK